MVLGGLGWAGLILMGYDCLAHPPVVRNEKSPAIYCLAVAMTVPQLLLIPATILITVTIAWQNYKQLRLGLAVIIPTLFLLTRLY